MAALGKHIFDFVEGFEDAHLGCAVFFGFRWGSAMGLGPGLQGRLLDQDTDREGGLAVGCDIEDVLSGGSVAGAFRRGSLADEVVLVYVPLAAGVGFHASDSHWLALG